MRRASLNPKPRRGSSSPVARAQPALGTIPIPVNNCARLKGATSFGHRRAAAEPDVPRGAAGWSWRALESRTAADERTFDCLSLVFDISYRTAVTEPRLAQRLISRDLVVSQIEFHSDTILGKHKVQLGLGLFIRRRSYGFLSNLGLGFIVLQRRAYLATAPVLRSRCRCCHQQSRGGPSLFAGRAVWF